MVSEERISRPESYHRSKNILLVCGIVSNLAYLGLCFLASFPQNVRNLPVPAQILLFIAVWKIWMLPIRFASGWWLDARFRMTRQPIQGWFVDDLKSSLIGSLVLWLGTLALYVVGARCPGHSWWVLTLGSLVASLFGAFIFPVWLLPLFYKIEPLGEDDRCRAARRALDRSGFPSLPLRLWRLGKKTSRANACLAGLGRSRQALISDTLLESHEPDEIFLVMAHEAGHHRLRHIPKQIIADLIITAVGLFGFFFCLTRYGEGDVSGLFSDTRLVPAYFLAFYLWGWATAPLHCALSRRFEYAADAFALERLPDLSAFTRLMEKLSHTNLANPRPSRLERLFLYTHPTLPDRIRSASRILGSSA